MTAPHHHSGPTTGPAFRVSVSGSARSAEGGQHQYHSDPATGALLAAEMAERFATDGHDGTLRVTIEETISGRTETIYGTDGHPQVVPYTVIRRLTVHQHGPHGAATYTRGDSTTTDTSVTINPHPVADPPPISPAWLDEPAIPPDAVLPVDDLHRALREFLTTARRPAAVHWRETPESYLS